ncbi:MAG: DUF1501 domain-containing protein [Pyrinomonadaceae bacterium]|nr:DUF1501 domain-containing protein [Pyrinomonadaceae bacterium]
MKQTRREFLKKSGCALSMVTLATQFEHFGLMSALAQQVDDAQAQGGENYKALVLVFMAGGNDGNNTLIPNHSDTSVSNYAAYSAARGTQGLAIAQNQLLPIAVPRMNGLNYGLHPSLGILPPSNTPNIVVNNGIHELWAQQKLAIVPNSGTLVRPTTKTQYQGRTVPLPYQLFSHSDQVSQFQAGFAGTQSFTGFGGRISDRMTLGNNPNGLIPMVTSINGAQLFTAGQTTLPVAINNAGTSLSNVLNPQGYGTSTTQQARLTAFNQLRTMDLDSNYVKEASHVTDLAMQANQALSGPLEVTVTFPNTSLGLQLKQVARLIKKRIDLNVNRQIFYCQIGSFDTHTNQIYTQATLLSQFSQAARAFYDEMGVQNAQNDVTMFTLSDFGRTFNPAGSGGAVGSDHAWGNHLFVLGGSVLGGDFYGVNASNGTPFPTLAFNGPDDADSGTNARGRWVPTTSSDQYAATLARWFGLPENQMASVFPNIGNFPTSNLLFMP